MLLGYVKLRMGASVLDGRREPARLSYSILSADIHTIGRNIRKVERSVMKKFNVLFVPVIGLMYLALFAQEPQGRGGQRSKTSRCSIQPPSRTPCSLSCRR
jgi:hypothetical protein